MHGPHPYHVRSELAERGGREEGVGSLVRVSPRGGPRQDIPSPPPGRIRTECALLPPPLRWTDKHLCAMYMVSNKLTHLLLVASSWFARLPLSASCPKMQHWKMNQDIFLNCYVCTCVCQINLVEKKHCSGARR